MNRFNTYAQAREFVSSLAPRGIVPGLDAVRALCAALGDPQDKIKTIHIAGTNGKGSVGAFIASALMADGKSVGRYATPAVEEYREMITLNGGYISEEDYTETVSLVAEAVDEAEKKGFSPTAFEAETAAAFLYFRKKHCDYALIECGMGGLLDATNIIMKPAAAVITSISTDHTAFLGDTIEEIARNKAGIIKTGVPVFTAMQPEAALAEIRAAADSLTVTDDVRVTKEDIYGTHFDYRDTKDIYIPLAGAYQPQNAALAFEVCAYLGIDAGTVKRGFGDTKWNLRFQADSDGWIFDGAHNEGAALELRESVDRLLCGSRLLFVMGVFRDKAYERILEITAPAAEEIITVKPPGDRGLEAELLAAAAKKYCESVTAAESYADAVRIAAEKKYDNILVFGSLSFLSELKREKDRIYGKMSENN